MNHTPGPWIGKPTSGDQGLIYSESDGRNVAVAYDVRDTDLIASAPDMKSILRRLAEKVKRANDLQHSGGRVVAEDWDELYLLTNEAGEVLSRGRGNG